ncbi:bifunctional folate synthesis protein [Peptococcaceae bacterium CEB3]|nr:bifunctional folate synthesis protein [Peptococcaceae bacterium CEB3]
MNVFLGLGGNLGDRGFFLREAQERLACSGVQIVTASGIYVSKPWGGIDQPDFWNMVLRVRTSLEPLELLRVCQNVELGLGRERRIHWGPRTIDIDILICDNIVSAGPELILPHPYLEERAFVLAPLREIAPELILPSGRPLREVRGQGEVWPRDGA